MKEKFKNNVGEDATTVYNEFVTSNVGADEPVRPQKRNTLKNQKRNNSSSLSNNNNSNVVIICSKYKYNAKCRNNRKSKTCKRRT